MKLTYRELIGSANDFQTGEPGPYARFRSVKKPIATASRMQAITRAFEQHANDYIELRNALIKEHGKPTEDGKNHFIDADGAEAYGAASEELLNVEVEIEGPRIKLSQLLSSTAISDEDLDALAWLIDTGLPREAPAKTKPAVEDEAPVEWKHGGDLEDAEAKELSRHPVEENVLDLDDKASAAAQ